MKRVDEALAQLRTANPLPDIADIDVDELALFLAHFEERRPSMIKTETREQVQSRSQGARRAWRPVLVFAAAVVSLLVLVGGTIVLVGGRDDPDVAPSPPSTSTAPATTEVSSETAVPTSVSSTTAALTEPFRWTRLDFGNDVAPFGPATHGDPGWVALQPAVDMSTDPWFSPDGLTWVQTANDDVLSGVCDPEIAYGRGTYLAIGNDCTVAAGLESSAVLLRSVDGTTWTRFPANPALAGLAVGPLTYGDPGFVALGGDGDDERGEFWINIFHSADGDTWTRVPHDEDVLGSAGWIDVRDVVYGAAGYVAIGIDDLGGDDQVGVVWHSRDGLTWDRVPNTGAIFGGLGGPSTWIELEAVAYGKGMYVIAGVGGVNPSIWVSTDGTDWTLLPDASDVFGTDEEALGLVGLTGGERGFLAIGHVLELQPLFEGSEVASWVPVAPAAWSSPDGLDWMRTPGDESTFGGATEVRFKEVAYGDGQFVIGGSEPVEDAGDGGLSSEHAVMWLVD